MLKNFRVLLPSQPARAILRLFEKVLYANVGIFAGVKKSMSASYVFNKLLTIASQERGQGGGLRMRRPSRPGWTNI